MSDGRGRPAQRYRVLDRMGETVAEGTVAEYAEQMGRGTFYVRSLVRGECSYPEHWAFPIDDSPAQKWDKFITPIREAFGIPVYRPKKGESK